jgi:iron complex transport system permease protein
VLISDITIRLLPTASEIKLGVLTALLGTPFFLYLVSKQRN